MGKTTHYNCRNPEHNGLTCCDCIPKKDCKWDELNRIKGE